MKITCPKCDSKYDVQLPGHAGKAIRVKCVRCQNKFEVSNIQEVEETALKAVSGLSASQTPDASASDPAAEQDTAKTVEVSEKKKETTEPTPAAIEATAPPMDSERLDDLLDEILKEELKGSSIPQTTEPDLPSIDKSSVELQANDDLEELLENILDQNKDAENLEGSSEKKASIQEPQAELQSDPDKNLQSEKTESLDEMIGFREPADSPFTVDLDDAPITSLDDLNLDETALSSMRKELEDRAGDEKDSSLDTHHETTQPLVADEATDEISEVERWAEAFANEDFNATGEGAFETISTGENEENPEDSSPGIPFQENSTDEPEGEEQKEPAEMGDANLTAPIQSEKKQDKDSKSTQAADVSGADEVGTMILPRKKRPAFLSMPSTKTGKLVLYGTVLAIILSAGSIFMAWKTLVPVELTQLGKAESPIPEGLTPKEIPQEIAKEAAGKTVQLPTASPEKPLPASKTEKALAPSVDKVKLETATKNSGKPSPGLQAALHPKNNSVILSTIMPVSYNVNDIRVLSFRLVVELTDPESANTVREALPIFENITVNTVEQLLENKFYNDILYIKEKLQKDILKAFNNKISGGGRVKRVRFQDFVIQ